MEQVEVVKNNNDILAIIIRKNYSSEGINFFTPDNFSQQLAFMRHKKGKEIKPHVHIAQKREVRFTQEVLILKTGKLKVNIFNRDRSFHSTYILESGDIILLADGGHGFEVLEDIEMIEVKQGPYAGEMDKEHF
jgi:hypothetical protein